MLRKIGFTLLLAAAFISTNTYSGPTYNLVPGLSVEFDFVPNEPVLFINYMYWEVNAECKIVSEDASDEMVAEALLKRGKINGIPISKGESMSLTVHNGDILKLSAESGAKVQITNRGEHTLKAVCVV